MIDIFLALDWQIHSFLYSYIIYMYTSKFWGGLILACITLKFAENSGVGLYLKVGLLNLCQYSNK